MNYIIIFVWTDISNKFLKILFQLWNRTPAILRFCLRVNLSQYQTAPSSDERQKVHTKKEEKLHCEYFMQLEICTVRAHSIKAQMIRH